MKRIFVVLLAVCILPCVLLTACGGSGQGSSAAGSDSAAVANYEAGQAITIDKYELTLSNARWTGLITEQVSSNMTISFEAAANGGETMLVFDCDFKNSGDGDYLAYAVGVSVETDSGDTLEGNGWSVIEAIAPNSDGHIYLYAMANKLQRDNFKSGTVTLTLRSCVTKDGKATVNGDIVGEYQFSITAEDIANS